MITPTKQALMMGSDAVMDPSTSSSACGAEEGARRSNAIMAAAVGN